MMHDAIYVARQIGKTPNWVKRHARALPHHKVGRDYMWTDEDIADILAATRVRPAPLEHNDGELRPMSGRRAS